MASTVTNSIPLPSVEIAQFPNGDLPPTILLSPANLHLSNEWCESKDANQSYLPVPGHVSRSNKAEKVSLTDKLKKVFRTKDRNSHSSDRSFKVQSRAEGHRHSETYSPSVVEALRNSSAATFQRHSEVCYPSVNDASMVRHGEVVSDETNAARLQSLETDLACNEDYHKTLESVSNAQESIHSTAASNLSIPDSVNSLAEKRSSSLLSYSKNKFKSSLQLFAKSLKKATHNPRERYSSECPSIEAKEADGPYFRIKGKYFHYNTINADAYKEIFQKQTGSTEEPTYLVTISPGSKGNFRQTLAPPVPGKKSRFIVSSTKTEKQPKSVASQRSGQMTIMAQLLKKPDENHNYNTVGPQDNRDRRPSVTLQDFLEMYKEKNLSGAEAFRKAKAERKRSISQSECETCTHIENPKSYHSCKPLPFKTPVITVTSDDDQNGTEVPQNMCACPPQTGDGMSDPSSPAEEKNIGEARHSIPEHQEVHHETQTGFGTFIPQGITARKNRFLNRGAVCATDCKAQTQHSRSTSIEGCPSLNPQRAALLPAYDHSLTVSGYPRRASRLTVKKYGRRMSEPNPKYQKWPEMKTSNSPSTEEISPSYRKVSANSLGIDIPTDEFQNKLLVWIDKKRGTTILTLPQEGQDVWSENRDENSGIWYLAKRYKCYNVMPTSGKLVLFDSELPVTAAFEAFTFNRVRSAPIWDAKKKQLTGMLTISDFIDVLLICDDQPELFEKITEQNISDWKSLSNKARFEANGGLDNSGIDDSKERNGNCFSCESNGESTEFGETKTCNKEVREESKIEDNKRNSLLDLTNSELDEPSTDLLHTSDDNKTTTIDSKETSSVDNLPDVSPRRSMDKDSFPMIRSSSLEPDNGSISFDTGLISVESDDTLYDAISVLKTFGFHRVLVMDYSDNDPLFILTYKRILYFIYVMMDTVNIPPFMSNSIKVLGVGTFSNLLTITYDKTLRHALSLFQWRSVSAIPVLDADGKVVDLYTKEDVMNLVYNNKFTQLNSTLEEILHDKRRIFEGLFKCKESDSLMAVVQYFISSKAHRLVVTSDDNKLQGIISLSDVVNFMVLGCEPDVEGLPPICH